MFITFLDDSYSDWELKESLSQQREYFEPRKEEFHELLDDLNVGDDYQLKKRFSSITKAFYKLNRSINKTHLIQSVGRDIRETGSLSVRTQIEIIKSDLLSDWLSEDQKKAIRAVLLFCETMPYKPEKDCSDDAYLILLLPYLEEIISNTYTRSQDWKEKKYVPYETLKKMFMVRLSLGFGEWSEEDISAEDLSLLARQNNLKSIQNAVSKKELYALKGKGPSQRINSQSARNWLTEKIKNRLIHFSWAEDGPALNLRSKLRYLNYFKIKYFQILCKDDLEHLEDCPDRGCYQLIVRDIESTRKIYHGSPEDLFNKLQFYFESQVFTDSSKSSGNYSDSKFHLLVFEPKQEGRAGEGDTLYLESLFIKSAKPHQGTYKI